MSIQISNPESRRKIRSALQEISDSMYRISSERDLIKTILDDKSEEFEIDKKVLRKMATVFHRDTFNENVAESKEFELLYENIVRNTTSTTQEEGNEED